ncbi:MAG: ParA family protein [Bacteroidota bacterium]|nr:ParA family protein [Bacteroidota bacterium]
MSNHKGGVGKTTSSINLGFALSLLKKKILLIDLDPQSNLSQSLGVHQPDLNIYSFIKKNLNIQVTAIDKYVDLIPSTIDLSAAEIELSTEIGREYILKNLLEPVISKYDYIIIDCPPSLGLLTINAFTTANEVLIPLQAEYLALQGLSKLVDVIGKIQKVLNKNLKIGGVFVTQYDNRKVLNREVVDSISEYLGANVFNTKIRENISLAEAPSRQLDIFRYEPLSKGAEDYKALAKEILKKQSNIVKPSK